ncbi:PadR family transcriptional regulator [Gemella cuniculi]|uniref:PadR family transcriptional regulator n=1 Tax=Gemella cuniculi TaxID=150240 RepID=UPI00040972DC|nr:PadR family transcriptional regulator [Gemella cuniculi]
MKVNSSQILKGTLEACILKLIKHKDMYGYEITENLSKYGLSMVAKGTIYPLLLKLEKEHLLDSYLKESFDGPPRKYYKISDNGIKFIIDFEKTWNEIKNSIDTILNLQGESYGNEKNN